MFARPSEINDNYYYTIASQASMVLSKITVLWIRIRIRIVKCENGSGKRKKDHKYKNIILFVKIIFFVNIYELANK